jgi:hypothetical protein
MVRCKNCGMDVKSLDMEWTVRWRGLRLMEDSRVEGEAYDSDPQEEYCCPACGEVLALRRKAAEELFKND